MKLERIRAEWQARGFGCDVWTDPPGQRWEGYVHDADELFLVLEGDVELELAGEARRPAVGEEVLIPAGVTHSVRNLGATTARWLYGYKGR